MHIKKLRLPLLALALCLTLSACGDKPGSGRPQPGADPSGIPAEEVDAGGLERLEVYFNDYLAATLALDGQGGYTLTSRDGEEAGTYTIAAGFLTLTSPQGTKNGTFDADGDLLIDGMTGYFFSDLEFWGFGEKDLGSAGVQNSFTPSETEEMSGGRIRYRDFKNAIAFTAGKNIEIDTASLADAAVCSDGSGGYVLGRNVTDEYLAYTGGDESFLEIYIRSHSPADLAALGIEPGTEGQFASLGSAGDTQLGSASLELGSYKVTSLLYSSAFSDGSTAYICKSFFVPSGDDEQLEKLADAVSDMCALKIIFPGGSD